MSYATSRQLKELEARVEALELALIPVAGEPVGSTSDWGELRPSIVELLTDNGYTTLAEAKEASDEALLDIQGVGSGVLRQIREA